MLIVLIWTTNRFPLSVIEPSVEDGIVENITALLFALSGLMFLWAAYALRASGTLPTLLLVGWGLLLVLFAGEEISWGQRIFGFATPEKLSEINRQKEFNFHNLEGVHETFGGTHRFLSLIMVFFGLVLPLANRASWSRQWIGRLGIPVPSGPCAILFLGAYVYGAYYALSSPRFAPDLQFEFYYSAVEVREMILSMATMCFAFDLLRRIPAPEPGAMT